MAALDLAPDTDVEALELGLNPEWDSVGHMALVAELEDRFGIALETDDLMARTSSGESRAALRRHGVEV